MEAEGMVSQIWAVKGVKVENQTPVSKGKSQGIHWAAGAAGGIHLQKMGVRFLPEAGLWVQEGVGQAYFYPSSLLSTTDDFLVVLLSEIPLHLLKMRTAFIPDISGTSNLVTCGFSLACCS